MGGSSWKCGSTFGGTFAKNLCERMSATSSWAWTNPSGPFREGTLVILRPCLQPATSHRLAFSIYSSAHLCFAARTVPFNRACVMARIVVSFAPCRFWAAMAHAAFHQGVAFGWNGHLLWKISSLVFCISLVNTAAACSTCSAVGERGRGRGVECFLNSLIHSSFWSGSTRKPMAVSIGGRAVWSWRCPSIWRRAWSDPRLAPQSIQRLVKVWVCIAASLNHARSMTESCLCSAPHCMISPGLFASVSRFVAAHSSIWPTQLDRGTLAGDQVEEWVLKSLTTKVGTIASMSRFMRA